MPQSTVMTTPISRNRTTESSASERVCQAIKILQSRHVRIKTTLSLTFSIFSADPLSEFDSSSDHAFPRFTGPPPPPVSYYMDFAEELGVGGIAGQCSLHATQCTSPLEGPVTLSYQQSATSSEIESPSLFDIIH